MAQELKAALDEASAAKLQLNLAAQEPKATPETKDLEQKLERLKRQMTRKDAQLKSLRASLARRARMDSANKATVQVSVAEPSDLRREMEEQHSKAMEDAKAALSEQPADSEPGAGPAGGGEDSVPLEVRADVGLVTEDDLPAQEATDPFEADH